MSLSVSAADNASSLLLIEEEKAFQAAADFAQASVVRIETFGGREIVEDSAVAAGPSSGTVIDSDGWIITSLFQFRGDPASITVVLPNGARKAAKLVARDHARAIGLLKIETSEKLTAATLSPRSSWQTGQWAIALGKTFDLVVASRSVGILSATDRIFGRAIQTDCKISPHNYGGPLIDIYGRVMGVLAPIDPGIATEGEVQQWYDSGIGFAVPLDDVLSRLAKLKNGEDIHVGKAGIRPKLNDDFRGPVELAGVSPGTPAAKAGMKSGDRILKIGSVDVRWPNHMRHALGVVDADNVVSVHYERDGKPATVDIRLTKELPVYRTPFLGLLLAEDVDGNEVSIRAVYPESPASKAGFEPGMLLKRLANEELKGLADLDRALAFVDYREPIEVAYLSDKAGKLLGKKITAEPWPTALTQEAKSKVAGVPEVEKKETVKDGPATGVVPVTMGDVPNQIFAFVPPTYLANVPHGLLVVMPEPGKIDRKKWVDQWEVFCRESRYIIAIVGSADPNAWQREELDIVKRTVQQLRGTYTIDSRRLAVGGIGAGGPPAMVLALQNRSLFRGTWFVECNVPRGLALPQAEPLESPAMLLQGSNPMFPKLAEQAGKLGYRAMVVDEKIELGMKLLNEIGSKLLNDKNQTEIESFLRSLEWF